MNFKFAIKTITVACEDIIKLEKGSLLDKAISTLWEMADKQEKYRWHDLRENPDDLPEEDVDVLVKDEYTYYVARHFNISGLGWSDGEYDGLEVIAWRYIEPFEEK